jgi:dTDP-4-dehydrorhamnose reductase
MACLAADFLQLDSKLLKKVTERDFEEPAKRPLKTGLVIDKAKKDLDYHPRSFMEGLKKTFTD